jgi:uncharacterized membrane protein HdeD (DUF308 family)
MLDRYPMPEEILQETWIELPPASLPAAGIILILAGLCLLFWTDVIVEILIGILGILAVLLGLGFLAAGRFLGRGAIPRVLLFIAGLFSIMTGILAFLRRDLVADLIIYLAAAIAILSGIFLLFIGGLLSIRGWGRRAFLWGGTVLLIMGIALALFPGLAARLLLISFGVALLAAGCAVLLRALTARRKAVHRL